MTTLSPYHEVAEEFPYHAVLAILDILKKGKKQGHKPNSWRQLTIDNHLLAAMGHIVAYMRGHNIIDEEEHQEHALCRLAMAVDLIRRMT